MASNEAILEIAVETRDALKNISKFQKKSAKSLQATKKSFDLLKVAAAGAVAVFASAKLVGGIKSVTEAASIQEDAINSLNSAMKTSGEFSEEASKDMQDFASSIQETTKFGDEAILQTLALAKAYGATNEQAKLVAEASTELAAATGKSLQTATEQISKSLGGYAGELGELNPLIKELTAEQLKAGGAAQIFLDKYSGTAAAQLETFSGSVSYTTNAFGDLQEEIGFLITRNPIVIKLVSAIGKAFKEAISFIQNNSKAISTFISKGLKLLISTVPIVIKYFSFMVKVWQVVAKTMTVVTSVTLTLIESFLEFDIVATVINSVTKAFKFLAVGALQGVKVIIGGLNALGANIKGVDESIDEMTAGLVEGFDNDVTAGLRDNVKALRENVEEFGVAGVESLESVENALDGVAAGAQKVSDDIAKMDLSPKVKADITADVEANVGDSFFSGLKGKFDKFVSSVNFADVGASIAGSLFKGAEGAREVLSKGAEGLAQALGASGPVGAAIGSVVGELSKGPEHVKEMVTGFVEAIPVLITNIAAALPELVITLIKALADQADEIIIALVKAVPRIVLALIKAMPSVAKALIIALAQLPAILAQEAAKEMNIELGELDLSKITYVFDSIAEAGSGLHDGILELKRTLTANNLKDGITRAGENFKASSLQANTKAKEALISGANKRVEILKSAFSKIKEIGKTIGADFKKIPSEFLGSLKDGLLDIFSKIKEQLTGGAGKAAGGAVNKVKKVFGLAEGGTVPKGFNDDTFPASLTSGELVVPRDDVSKLRSFLNNNQGGEQGGVSSALLAQIADLLAQPVQVSTTAEVDGEAMANIMLNLSRQNARTA